MRKNKWGLILSGLLLLTTVSPLLAAEVDLSVVQPLDATATILALQNLANERDGWAQSFDWGDRAEYPQRLVIYNYRMKAFQLERLQLQLALYRMQGDAAAAERTEINIDQLVNGIHGTDLQLPRVQPPVEDNSVKGGAR